MNNKFAKLVNVSLLLLVLFFSQSLAVQNLIGTDPTYIGVGARPLGMGKAYVAVAEDGDTVFMNPAGVARALTPKLTSMYSNLLNDVNYMVLGGVYPQSKTSALGAGAIINSVDGIDLRDSNGTSIGSAKWGTSLFFLSYGYNLENINLQLGGSLKYFTQGGSGTATIENSSSSGVGFDIGAIYSPNENLSFGASLQNPIGSKLISGNNVENILPSNTKIGMAYKMRPFDERRLILALDADIATERPLTLHFGGEYQLTSNVSIRGGIDQDPSAGEVATNPTFGVGFGYSGMEFNYAYHPYLGVAEDSTHYFSISYIGGKPASDDEAALSITLLEPSDRTIVYTDNVSVKGLVRGKRVVASVMVNGTEFPVDKNGTFTASIPLSKVGKKLVLVEAKDISGKSATASRKVLRLINFADVSQGYWAKKPIEGSGTLGLVQGYPDGKFLPERVLTRAELATLLVRAKGIDITKPRTANLFKDLTNKHWASAYIQAAVDFGYMKGYPDNKFRPNKKISKAESITVLARYDALPTQKVAQKPYSDVSVKHWSAKYIQAAKDSGLLSYIDGDKLGIKSNVTRAEVVEMLSKTAVAGRLIWELFSWDKGYEYERSLPALKAQVEP